MSTKAPTYFVTMGGTIDKDYVESTASLEVAEPFIAWIGPSLRTNLSPEIVVLARKDSRELAGSDRARLLDCVAQLEADRVVVTHGTDTLLPSAMALLRAKEEGRLKESQTIVFTGAFRPGRFAPAEGSFNIGFALGIASTAPPGVYVAIGGEYASADKVRHAEGRFVYE